MRSNGKYYDPPTHCTMFRDASYKLNVYHDTAASIADVEGELFDMEKDPAEQVNLWDQPDFQTIKLRLLNRLMNWLVEQDLKN